LQIHSGQAQGVFKKKEEIHNVEAVERRLSQGEKKGCD